MTVFADLVDLRTAVLEEVEDDRIVPRFARLVGMAEARMDRELRTRHQIASASVTISSGTASVPAGFKQAIGLFAATGRELLQRPYQISGQQSIYDQWAIDGSNIIGPNGDYTLKYYAAITGLSAMTDTNVILREFPEVYLWCVTTEGLKSLRRADEAAIVDGLARQAIANANREDAQARYARSAVRVQGMAP